jgi:CBS domain-containing protein
MSPAPLTLDPEASVDEAMSLLFNYGVHGAPVVTNDLKLVGMVSTFDFLWEEAFEGSLLPMQGSAENIEKYISAAKKICGKRVEDVMVTELWEVTPKTTMRTAAAIMTEQRIHHLPVVDEEGRLVGILSSGDVMKDLLHIVNYLPAGKDDEADKSTDGKP